MIERKDNLRRSVTVFDDAGKMLYQRAYNDAEDAELDAALESGTQAANKSTIEANLNQDYLNMQAIDAQTNAAIRTDPSQEVKDLARAVRRLTRMALQNYSGND